MSPAAVIEARRLTRILPGPVPVTLVADIDLAIASGDFLAITGPSGSGKSSLLYLLGLLDAPSSGEVLIEGAPTRALTSEQRARIRLEKLGFVFQFHFLLPEFSALANVLIPMKKLRRAPERELKDRARSLLAALGLEGASDKLPGQLSGGERQRVAIARALANDPAVLLADEPTGNLDTRNSAIVFDIFAGIAEREGRSVVAVTHDLELARRAGRRVHLVDGRLAPVPA